MSKRPEHGEIYPIAPGETAADRIACAIGEYRPPQRGEWYIFDGHAYLAMTALTESKPICTLLKMQGVLNVLVSNAIPYLEALNGTIVLNEENAPVFMSLSKLIEMSKTVTKVNSAG